MIKIAFLGAGRMATAMVSGLLDHKCYSPEEIACLSAADGTGEALAKKFGIRHTDSLEDLLAKADIIVLAFKPQQLADMGTEHARLSTGKLIVSILAGSPLNKLSDKFPEARNIIRSMPNTPGQIGAGITCYSPLQSLEEKDQTAVENILGSMGPVIALSEEHLDAVTAVSGSGPAYVFEFVAALRDGGINAGLDPEVAYKLAMETTLGAARLLARSGEKPETLRDWVSSPGGTTLAGLGVMKQGDFRQLISDTVAAAKKRSIELADQ